MIETGRARIQARLTRLSGFGTHSFSVRFALGHFRNGTGTLRVLGKQISVDEPLP